MTRLFCFAVTLLAVSTPALANGPIPPAT